MPRPVRFGYPAASGIKRLVQVSCRNAGILPSKSPVDPRPLFRTNANVAQPHQETQNNKSRHQIVKTSQFEDVGIQVHIVGFHAPYLHEVHITPRRPALKKERNNGQQEEPISAIRMAGRCRTVPRRLPKVPLGNLVESARKDLNHKNVVETHNTTPPPDL